MNDITCCDVLFILLKTLLIPTVLSYIEQADKSEIENETNEDATDGTQVERITVPQTDDANPLTIGIDITEATNELGNF